MINKLVEKIKKTGAPIVVGLDPMLNYIPQHVLDKAYAEYGETLEGAAEAVWQFNKMCIRDRFKTSCTWTCNRSYRIRYQSDGSDASKQCDRCDSFHCDLHCGTRIEPGDQSAGSLCTHKPFTVCGILRKIL